MPHCIIIGIRRFHRRHQGQRFGRITPASRHAVGCLAIEPGNGGSQNRSRLGTVVGSRGGVVPHDRKVELNLGKHPCPPAQNAQDSRFGCGFRLGDRRTKGLAGIGGEGIGGINQRRPRAGLDSENHVIDCQTRGGRRCARSDCGDQNLPILVCLQSLLPHVGRVPIHPSAQPCWSEIVTLRIQGRGIGVGFQRRDHPRRNQVRLGRIGLHPGDRRYDYQQTKEQAVDDRIDGFFHVNGTGRMGN